MNTWTNSLKWAASLLTLAISLGASSGVAHADPKLAVAPTTTAATNVRAATVNPGSAGTVRQQIHQNAVAAGLWQKGTSIRLEYNANRTQVKASLWSKSTFGGGPTPLPKAVREENASGNFHVFQAAAGPVVKPIKQEGSVWQRVYRGVRPQTPAK